MSKYVRKTIDEYDVQQWHSGQWETVDCQPTRKEAQASKKVYRENQPEYAIRIVKHRVKRAWQEEHICREENYTPDRKACTACIAQLSRNGRKDQALD